jgi:hypothetical protein
MPSRPDPRVFDPTATGATDIPSQRWRHGRHTWRRQRDGGFDPSLYDVVQVPEAIAKDFTVRNHYAASYPAARFSFGLVTTDERLEVDGVTIGGLPLVGVAVVSVPMSAAVLTRVFPTLEPNVQSLELGRLVLSDTPPTPSHGSWPESSDGSPPPVSAASSPSPIPCLEAAASSTRTAQPEPSDTCPATQASATRR